MAGITAVVLALPTTGEVRGTPATGVLEWPDGSRITLETGASAVLLPPDRDERLRLEAGTLRADIATQRDGRAFVITTPHARTTVVGTRFRQSAAAEGTWLTVEHGRVRLLGGQGPEIEIAAGEAAAVATDGKAHPWTRWPDRRPIGALTLSNEGFRSPGNPGGWWKRDGLDLRGDAGRRLFADQAERAADAVIAGLEDLGAQGVVVWDIEGSSAAAPIYPGDPRLLPRLAPEMDAVADRFFARLAAAGFATGVRIGLHPLVAGSDGVLRVRPNDDTMVDEAAARITAARTRWGCSLFFLGHNLTASGLAASDAGLRIDRERDITPTGLLARLRLRFPGCLILAEHLPDNAGPAAVGLLPGNPLARERRLAEQGVWTGADAVLNLLADQDPAQAVNLIGRAIPLVALDRPDLAHLGALFRRGR
jgi:hypothetical protein